MIATWSSIILILLVKNIAGLVLDKFEYCNNAEFPINVYPGKYFDNKTQYVSSDYRIGRDIGSNTKVNIIVSMDRGDNKWKQIIKTTHSKGASDFYNKFGGEMWWDMEKAFNMTPKECPLKAGSYAMKNYMMNLGKMRLPKLPKGRLKLDLKIVEKKNNKLAMCPVFYILTG